MLRNANAEGTSAKLESNMKDGLILSAHLHRNRVLEDQSHSAGNITDLKGQRAAL